MFTNFRKQPTVFITNKPHLIFASVILIGTESILDEDAGKKDGKETETKEQITVGIEQIKKVEVYYCELCRMYLPRVEENDVQRVLTKHCKMRIHMQQYVRYKEDKDLAKHAERLQRKENAEREKGEKKVRKIVVVVVSFVFSGVIVAGKGKRN